MVIVMMIRNKKMKTDFVPWHIEHKMKSFACKTEEVQCLKNYDDVLHAVSVSGLPKS